MKHYRKRSPETSSLIDQLLTRYGVEGMTMRTMEEFRQYYLKYHLPELTPEERMAGLPPEERLKGLPPEERLKGLPPEEFLKRLSADEIRAYLKRLENGSAPEQENVGP